MATALTISASNPLANPLRGSYGGRRKSSKQMDGASVYHKQPSLKESSFSLPPSPILVVVPTPSANPTPLSLTPSTSTPTTSTPSTTTPTTGSPLKLSYADVVKSSPVLKTSPLKSSSSSPSSPTIKPSPLATSQPPTAKSNSRMDKKLDFEAERSKLKARRLAKKGYEKQTGKRWDSDMSHQEWEIYQAQVKLHEAAIAQEKHNHEEANALALNIQYKEVVLQQLQTDLANKIKQIEDGKDALERFRLDMEDSIKQLLPASSSSERSSSMRMKEEQQKKKLRAAWRNTENSDDPVQKTRRDILIAQEDVADFNLRIVNLKKELKVMKDIAAREASSKLIMRAEKKQRDDMKKAGIEKPKHHQPKPKAPPKPIEPRSHQQRMAEQKALKEKARAERRAAAAATAAAPSS